jgi:cellulose synthase/poly-beta-1,6-N-acetylglucosamine synthase-like glycosyltransferase
MIPGQVTIVIPVYNYGRYVAQAIDSALAQTYRNVDIIVINDGSTDKTADVLKHYEGNGCMRIIHQENAGVGRTRNRGAAMTDAEFLLFLDADDWIKPSYLERTVPHMADQRVGIVSTDYENFGAGNSGLVRTSSRTLEQQKHGNNIPITSLIRKKVFDEAGGYTTAFTDAFHNNHQLAFEDWNLWIDILKRGWLCRGVNEPLFQYRMKTSEDREWRNSPETLDGRGDVGAWCIEVIHKLHPELYK